MNCSVKKWTLMGLLCLGGIGLIAGWVRVQAEETKEVSPALDLAAQKEALAAWNGLIGGWRGTGQPRRGANAGAWREDTNWSWEFTESGAALIGTVTKGKLASTLKVTATTPEKFHLQWTTPEAVVYELDGRIEENKLVVVSEPDEMHEVHRITLTPLNEQRTLILFEKRKAEQQNFNRIAEVGYTREGTRLAGPGGGQPECVVTGGLGTIKVEYKGKSYFVCCTGCQQAFDEDPEGILADYQARREKEKNDGKK